MRFGIKTIVTITCAMFLFMGIVIGFIIAPIKKGIYFSSSGSKYSDDEDMWDEDWDEDDWHVGKSSNEDIPF